MGTQSFFFVPCSQQDVKHLSLFIYQAKSLPSILFYLELNDNNCWHRMLQSEKQVVWFQTDFLEPFDDLSSMSQRYTVPHM